MHLLLNNGFGKGELTSTQKEGIIMCIPKEDKSTRKGGGGGGEEKKRRKEKKKKERKKKDEFNLTTWCCL